MARYGRRLAAAALAACLAAGCSGSGGEPADGEAPVEAQRETQTDGRMPRATDTESAPQPGGADKVEADDGDGYEVLAERLRVPWAIDFAEDAVFVSERDGFVVRVEADGSSSRKPVTLAQAPYARQEGGLLGFVLAPDYETSGAAFVYHTYEEGGGVYNRIVRIEERADEWAETRALLERIPGSELHDGGRLAIGPDGLLYATTGDAWDGELAQRLDSLAGKILRMTTEGDVPDDNPFPGSYVYSYGHRNPQGIAWNADGVLYATEHGPSGSPSGHDEINRIEPGANYGWPIVYGSERTEGAVPPEYHTGVTAIAPSGAAFDGEGRLLVAALRGEALFRYATGGGALETLLEDEGRLRDVKAHEGRIYVVTNNTDGRGRPSEADDRLLVLDAVR